MVYPELQEEPKCPHCGYVETDAWEFDFGPGLDGSTEICCGNCGKDYRCERECTAYYRSFPPATNPESEGSDG